MDMSLHEFERKSYSKPTKCKLCNKLLLGLTKQGMHCGRCHVDVHSGCMTAAKQKFACLNSAQHNAAIPHHPDLANASAAMGGLAIGAQDSNQNHDFKAHTFTSPTNCSVCTKFLVGVYKQGVRCSYCRLAVHRNCQDAAISSITCDPTAIYVHSNSNNQSTSTGTDMKSKFRTTTASLGSKATAAKIKLSNEMKRFRNSSGSSGDRPPIHISAPTNVYQVGGTTKLKDRTLIPISKAQENPQQYGIKPGLGGHYNSTAEHGTNIHPSPSVDQQQPQQQIESIDFFPDPDEKYAVGPNIQVPNPFEDETNANGSSVLDSFPGDGNFDQSQPQSAPRNIIPDNVTTKKEKQKPKPVIPKRPASYQSSSEFIDDGFPTSLQRKQRNSLNAQDSTVGSIATSAPPRPPPPVSVLPAGWVELIDDSSGSPYYYNRELGVTQWDRPQ